MSLWDHLNNFSVTDAERAITVHAMGTEIKKLHEQGYSVDADRLLDELHERLSQAGRREA